MPTTTLSPWKASKASGPEPAGPSLGEVMSLVGYAYRPQFNDLEPGVRDLVRTMTGSSGGPGGFAIHEQYATSVWDKCRSVDGPLARCKLVSAQAREFSLPIFAESSRSNGSRWGGVQATWQGTTETAELSTIANQPSQPSLNRVNFIMNRLMIFTEPISRDLLQDSELMPTILEYAALSELRWGLETAILFGTGQGMPTGVANSNSQATITVPKDSGQSTGTITNLNIDNCWKSLYGPCKRNAVWLANDDVIALIDETAQTGGWAESIYLPQGVRGNEFPLLKGRPLLMSEQCLAAGTPGDLVLCDFSQYWLIMHRPKKGDTGLAFDVGIPRSDGFQGIVALPENYVEQTSSDQQFFNQDTVAFKWKLRCDGRFIWRTPLTNINGAQVGPCAIIAARP
jgi:HK97 family phage major capsid protein